MNKIIFRTVILFSVCISLVTCDNYEFPESLRSRFATMKTFSPDVKEKLGVIFHGSIETLGQKPIVDHGFVWGLAEDLDINDDEHVSLGTTSRSGAIQAEVIGGFRDDISYHVAVFVKTDSYVVYGDPVKFLSKGSPTPIVDQLIPDTGTWGDTILIEGQFFSPIKQNNIVRFGMTMARVVASTESTITCVVPGEILVLSVPVRVSVAMAASEVPKNFTLTVPVIESFAPATGTFGDVITITGKNFSTSPFRHFVYLDDRTAPILSSTRTTINVKVPNEVIKKLNKIKVILNKQTAESTDNFVMLPPTISGLSPSSGLINSTVQIIGNNFSPLASGNIVLIDGKPATIINASAQQLTVKVPPGTYSNPSNAFKVTVAEQTATSAPFTILN